ncbi:MAG: DUF1588 domain-containing protein, partial [Myxococcota bacterium]
AGLLTHPQVMRHFHSNLAFRRVRWVQETFACSEFPAEIGEPQDVGGENAYTSPWPFESISGEQNGGRVDFLDTESTICANCHGTMNHIGPLFANFDANGTWSGDIAVELPSMETAVYGDYLPESETTAWRVDAPAADLPALGRVLAADPEIDRCSVARLWNWAFGKGDIIGQKARVPEAVIAELIAEYRNDGHRMRPLLRRIFTHDDFVRF